MRTFVLLLFCLSLVVSEQDFYQGSVPVKRPPGLATYVPKTSTFNGRDFISWAYQQPRGADGYIQAALKQGTYDVYPGNDNVFYMWRPTNMILWMDDVTLVFRTRLSQFAWLIDGAVNSAIRGVRIEFNPPEGSQGIVYNITKVNDWTYWVDVQVCDGYPVEFMYSNKVYYVHNPKTLLPNDPFRNNFDFWVGGGAISLSPDNKKLRITTGYSNVANGNCNIGDIMATRGTGVAFGGLFNSKNFSFVDVTITSCGTHVFWIEGGYGGHRFERVRIYRNPNPPIPGGVPPVISSGGDVVHAIGMQVGPTVTHCWFEGNNDDGINMLNWFAPVQGYPSEKVITVKAPSYWTPNDLIRLYDSKMAPLGYSRISSMTPFVNGVTNMTLYFSHMNAAFLSDRDRVNSGFLIEHNTFINHRARGVLLKGSNGTIAHNNFTLITLGGIFIMPENGDFTEGDYAQSVVVFNNTFENVGASAGTGGGAIHVRLNSDYIPPAGAFSDITITNNVIKGGWGTALRLYSTDKMTIANNKIYPPFRSPKNLFLDLQNNNNVKVTGNCVYGVSSNTTLTNSNLGGINVCG